MIVPVDVLAPVTRLAVIGDVHLGRGDAETGYSGDAEGLCAALEALADHADCVIINGDLYDLDRGVVPTAQWLEYRRLQPRWAQVEAKMRARGVRLTTGNHDHTLRDKIVGGARACGAYRVPVGDWLVHVEHGERFNAWIKRSRHFTSAVTWLSGRVSQGPWRPIYALLRRMEARTTDDCDGGVSRRAASWLRRQPELDIMIIGHTHQRDAQELGSRWLLNPGDAMRPLMGYLVIDAQKQEILFGTVDQNGARRVTQRLALFPPIGKSQKIAARVI